jgi:hypothetical protein
MSVSGAKYEGFLWMKYSFESFEPIGTNVIGDWE